MNNQERQQLSEILASLEAIRGAIPSNATYSQGRIKENAANALLEPIRKLKELVENEPAAAPTK